MAPVPTRDGPVPCLELATQYYEGESARFMDEHQPLRFEKRFGYDRAHMIADLGTDVVPAHHQFQTGQYTAMVISRMHELTGSYPFPPQYAGTVMLASMVHDCGETLHPDIVKEAGVGVGDIPFGMKTAHDLASEAAVRAVVYRRELPGLEPTVIRHMEGIITHDMSVPGSEQVEAGHDLDTFNTAVLAGKAIARELELFDADSFDVKLTREPHEIMRLISIASAIFTSMDGRFMKWAKQLQIVDELAVIRRDARLPA